MTPKTFVGLYDTESALLTAIEGLDEKGIAPENMYVIARNEEDVDMLRRRSSEDIQSAPSNWLDRFIGYISGENHVRSMLVEIGFDEADLRRYEAEIKQGKWLLYVDGEPEKSAYEINAERHKEETNPFDKPISEAEQLNKKDESPVGIGEDGLPKNEYRDSVVTDGYEGSKPDAREDLLFGRAGAEALFDTSEYEPTASDLPPPSQVRGTPSEERGRLHRGFRRQMEIDAASEKSPDVIANPQNFMESQMDRQDAMAETTVFDELPGERDSVQGIYPENVTESNKPIIIDLRNVGRTEDYEETWLLPKNWDRDRDK